MDILLISAGLVCFLVGLAGTVKVFGVKLPVFRTVAQNILLLTLGLTLVVVGFYVRYYHPPGATAGITVTADSIAPYVGPCPVKVAVTGSISIGEGKGDVGYHAVLVSPYGAHINGRPLNAYFWSPGTQNISYTFNLVSSATPGNFMFYFQTDSPTRHASNEQSFTLECRP
jgi:hypothetical protein